MYKIQVVREQIQHTEAGHFSACIRFINGHHLFNLFSCIPGNLNLGKHGKRLLYGMT